MNIIFLDIDWVLIRFWNTKQIKETRTKKWDIWKLITSLDEDLVDNLVNILKQTNAFIVISSSWRRNLRETLRDEFYKNWDRLKFDLWNRVISKTPFDLWYWRWNEILTWVQEYHKTCNIWEHIKNWIAIDDDDFDMKCIKRLWNFIKTETHIWLNKEISKQIIEKFKT